MELFDVWLLGFLFPVEDVRRSVQELLLPLRDLIRVDLGRSCQFHQRLLSFRLSRYCRAATPLKSLFSFSGPALFDTVRDKFISYLYY